MQSHKCKACRRTLLETDGAPLQSIRIKCRKCGEWNEYKPERPEAAGEKQMSQNTKAVFERDDGNRVWLKAGTYEIVTASSGQAKLVNSTAEARQAARETLGDEWDGIDLRDADEPTIVG
jgi:phage FluMu protein Com